MDLPVEYRNVQILEKDGREKKPHYLCSIITYA